MTRFFLALIRLAALALSFILSTAAAAGFLTFTLFLGGDTYWLAQDPGVAVGATAFWVVMWFGAAQLAFLPALAILLILEFGRFASLITNLVAGGFCAIAVMVLLDAPAAGASSETPLPYGDSEIWLAGLAAGFAGGFVHWVLAGHRAGRWLGPVGKETDS